MKHLILIDTSWLLQRSRYAFKDLSVWWGLVELKSGHLYGVMKTLKQMSAAFPDATIMFCLDGSSQHNKDVDSAYKANRNHGDFNPMNDLGVLTSMILAYPNTRVVYHKNFEADEIIAGVARWAQVSNLYDKVTIFSADNDMLQLVGGKVVFSNKFTTGKFDEVTEDVLKSEEKWVKKYAGCSVAALPLFRALVGDSSDNLKGFPRLRKKLAKEWAEEYFTADDLEAAFYANPASFPVGFEDFIPKLKTNYKIMRLPSKEDIEATGLIFNVLSHESSSYGVGEAMFNLFRMRTVSPKPLKKMVASQDEWVGWLNLADEINTGLALKLV